MVQWADFDWSRPMFRGADEAILTQATATIENATHNPAGGMSRFPGLTMFAGFPGDRIYPTEWNGDLYAATDAGRLYRVSRSGVVSDVTGVPISGGRRVIFDAADDRLLMAAGGPILQLIGARTELLSANAPETSHVAYIDGYLIAIERWTNRFRHCPPGEFTVWNDIDVFSANAKPSPIHAAVVTPYRELLLGGPKHIEQFERLPNGQQPFSRRWTTGEGVAYPYTLVTDKSGTYGVNPQHEFVRFAGQVSQDQAESLGMLLSRIDDWTDAWAASVPVDGMPYVILQAPFATSPYGEPGVTLLLSLQDKRWSFLYGHDRERGTPVRYPAWGFVNAWGRTFVGVPGGLAVLDTEQFENLGQPSAFVVRSGHVDKFGPSRIDNMRVRIKRGVGRRGERPPLLGLRVNRDQLGFDQWQWEPLGVEGDSNAMVHFGPQGCADTWQFEMRVTDPVDVQFVSMQIQVERLSW